MSIYIINSDLNLHFHGLFFLYRVDEVRCLRLNKNCQPGPTIRKKPTQISRKSPHAAISTINPTAALEKKLDSIVQLLQGPHSSPSTSDRPGPNGTSPTPHERINGFDGSDHHISVANESSSASAYPFSDSNLTNRSLYSTSASSANTPRHPKYPLETDEELQECLDTYRSKMVQYFPVVILPPGITVKEMEDKRPFLWLVIRAISSQSLLRQKHLGIELKRTLGQAILVDGIKSLDLLLGILVFCGWCQYYIYRKPVVTQFIQLGMSLAYDLGLTKLNSEPHRTMLDLSSQGCPKPLNRPSNVPKTIEERRAVVGLFLVSSMYVCLTCLPACGYAI
jgi:hypothetical protein